jgi:colanic acid/amylovoran biosynthesis glycosyltransferase
MERKSKTCASAGKDAAFFCYFWPVNRRLIVLTNSFPTSGTETFFINELPFLSAAFDEVHIVPVEKIADSAVMPLPPNARAHFADFSVAGRSKLSALSLLAMKQVRREIRFSAGRPEKISRKVRIATILLSWKRAGRIAAFLRTLDIGKNDVLYSYWADDSALALARLKKSYPEARMVTRCHGWDLYYDGMSDGYLPFRSFIAEELDNIYPISSAGKDYIAANWGAVGANVRVSRLGVKNLLKKLNPEAAGERKIVISVSSLVEVKRIPFLVEVLSQTDTPVEWIHFGDGPGRDELMALAEEKLPANVNFVFKGYTPNAALIDWQENNHVDVLINVSRTEGIPVSIMEAISRGIPVVATAVGGTPEIVGNENGLLIDVRSSAGTVAQQLGDFLESGLTAKRQGALTVWSEKFDAEVNYREFIAMLIGQHW